MIEQRTAGSVIVTHPGGSYRNRRIPRAGRDSRSDGGNRLRVSVSGLLVVYLWIHPQTRQQFLRIVYRADMVKEDISRHWIVVFAPYTDIRWRISGCAGET